MPIYRMIEESVGNSRYEHYRPSFEFKKKVLDSWSNLESALTLEIRELALHILLGAPSTASGKVKHQDGPFKWRMRA
jgi:hypothetical protein